MRRVELGEVMGNVIAVLKGVNAGERVVVSGATLLVDGDPVRVSVVIRIGAPAARSSSLERPSERVDD